MFARQLTNYLSSELDAEVSVGSVKVNGFNYIELNAILIRDLNRDTFLGNLSPITGAIFTADNAAYIYTGVQAHYSIGALNIIPSFTPGLYEQGDGKDLGHMLEFKSEVQLSLDLPKNSQFGFSYNHLSNASLGDKNPGANSYMFNFLKKF